MVSIKTSIVNGLCYSFNWAKRCKKTTTTSTERYWEVYSRRLQKITVQADHCRLILQMFVPGSGVLSKNSEEQCADFYVSRRSYDEEDAQ